ncbi:MAG: repeat family protein [Frankiales bacterium]|nr:repeat family protein [Frankiales bacterium]
MHQRFRIISARAAVGGLSLAAAGWGVAGHAQAAATNQYTVQAIVTDATGAATVDPDLVNPWGMAQGPTSPVWVANNGTSTSTLYATGPSPKQALTVTIPGGAPTGQVFNGTTGFQVTTAGTAAPARFIFSSESGVISGWSSGTSAVRARTVRGAIYKGLAIATRNGSTRLYATDFAHGRVDVFRSNWQRVTLPRAFKDSRLPSGYMPFGIQAIGSRIYVSYALRHGDDDVAGSGHGYVDVFTTSGALVKRLIKRGALNSPWAMVKAPAGWGAFGGRLLVGNFGDGKIHAYDANGVLTGTLQHAGTAIVLPGLWGLLFGNGTSAPKNALMFTSGPGAEKHGRWGVITAG